MSAASNQTAGEVAALLERDDLGGAVKAAGERLRASPNRDDLRLALVDLLILSGDLDRADKVAALGATIRPANAVGITLLRGVIQGLMARRAWLSTGALPAFPNGPTTRDQAAVRLQLALNEGDGEAARAALAEIDAAPAGTDFEWNGEPVAGSLRDLDDRLPHAFEAVTSGGAYLWIDFERVRGVEFAPVARPRDLALRRARIELRDGAAADVFVPAIYPEGPGEADDALRLGRRTDWAEAPGGLALGRGQRSLLVGEESRTLLNASRISFGGGDA
ncbi:type VI secretion system accessory protein TagJ [Aureimonas leprariae]|uniref:Nitrogen fixation protein n=1 Tax=Plantimonas leprariae TaxID=2615207 RepID=A0A7V7PQ88_9HYPH|nr:type VI secretion system accessory protein TagJ [Aureimonas leprariae]KAB0680240.1 nitrogen fixation protein [Aureimonas leprariae]